MKRCTVCRVEIYRGFAEHVQMHEQARRNRAARKLIRIQDALAGVSAGDGQSGLVEIGTEVSIPDTRNWFQKAVDAVRNFFRGN